MMACYKSTLIDLDSRRGNKGQDMSKMNRVFSTKCEKCGTINISSYEFTSCYKCSNKSNQPERLKRVDAETRSDSTDLHE